MAATGALGNELLGKAFLAQEAFGRDAIDGLSGKVLNERLAKLVRFDILDKTSFPEVPPRVEYDLTAFGRHFITLIDQVDQLQQTLERTSVQRSGNAKSR